MGADWLGRRQQRQQCRYEGCLAGQPFQAGVLQRHQDQLVVSVPLLPASQPTSALPSSISSAVLTTCRGQPGKGRTLLRRKVHTERGRAAKGGLGALGRGAGTAWSWPGEAACHGRGGRLNRQC